LTVLLVEKEIGEGGNGRILPKIDKIGIGCKSCDKMDVALIRFTLIDKPDPPLA
jgi:hypothetical protein